MKNILTPPVFTDERKTHTARLLYVLLWTLLLSVSVMILIGVVLPEIALNQLLLIGAVDASSILLLILTIRGYTRLVSWMVIIHLWFITTALASTGGGLHNPVIALYLIVALVAGLTLGQRTGLIVAGFCLLTEMVFVYAEQANVLLPSLIQHNALTIWLSTTWVMIIIVSLQYFAASTVSGSFDRVHEELSARKRAEEYLRASEEKYREILENIDDGYYEVDLAGRFTFSNDVLPKFMGYTYEELKGLSFKAVMDDNNAKKVFEAFNNVYRTGIPARLVEWESTRRDGSTVYVESSISLIKDNEGIPSGFRGVVRDITERKQLQDKLQSMAITDPLTGLYNRRGFTTFAEQQLFLANETKRKMLLAYIDLDGMKVINDTWGHEEGDKALIDAAMLLKKSFRESDIVARIGGDEFAVLAIEVSDSMPDIFTDRLQHMLDTYNKCEKRNYKLSVSFGFTLYEAEKPCSLDELMSRADKLMYENKRRKTHLEHN